MGALRPPYPPTAERGGAVFGLCHNGMRLFFLATDERGNLKNSLRGVRFMKNYGGQIEAPHFCFPSLTSAYKKRKTIGQFTTKPVEPYLAPPGPVIQPCSTRPRIWNSSDTLERMPLSMASFVHSPAFTSHNGL